MAKPNLPLNTNFKVCARIRPLEYTSRMLEVTNESTVTIRDINNKTNMEKQSFHFNKVFDQNSRQESVFNYVVDNAINKALEGTNCCILSYGQTGAGKTHTTFGDDEKFSPNTINLYSDTQKDKKGLIPKTIEYLLKKNSEMQGVRELILTCSFVEIYLDQVRDLSRNFTDRNAVGSTRKRSIGGGVSATTTYENENLEIYEHANGQMLIRNVKNVIIKSMDELIELLSSGFLVREKAESKGSQIWARAHTIFTINIVQKEVENEDLPFPKSMIQFVDLAGSERIAKSITEGQHKFQEAVLIMSHLTSLYKVLSAIAGNSKNIPYRDSKLTKVLYNCLTPYNNIIMFVHLHPAESNFEETLNTLQYAERSKNTDPKEKWGMGGNPSAVGGMEESNAYTGVSGTAATDKLWKKMTDEISELKTKVETLQRDQKAKLDRVQQFLGLEIDLDKVSSNSLSKEAQALTALKNTFQENQNLKVSIAQAEEQFEIMKREIDEDRREFYQKQSKMEGKNVELREYMKKDIDKFKTDKNKDEEDLRRQIQQLTDENKKLAAHNAELFNEKSHALRNFSTNLEARTKELTQGQDMKDIGKREAETQFREELNQLKTDYNRVTESLKQQYEHWLQAKNEEIDVYAKGVQDRQKRKKAQISSLKNEIVELHSLLQRQEKIIEKVENGGYSGGLKSFQIPTKDKCSAPTRQEFPHLYKALDEKKTEGTQSLTKEREPEGTQPLHLSNRSPPILASKSQARFSSASLQNTGMSGTKKSLVRMDSDEPDLNANIIKMERDDLKRYVESIRRMCLDMKQSEKGLREEADKFVQLNVSGNIRDIIGERDKYKELYQEEVKRNNENRMAIESQQRLLTSAAKSTSSQAKIRPGTAGWYLLRQSARKTLLEVYTYLNKKTASALSL